MIKISEIKSNPNNPRIIKDERFNKLVQSIKEFPKMMELRPMVVDENNIVLGGNMRLKALNQLKYKEIPNEWIKKASDLTPAEIRRFIIADNVGFGDHDFDLLRAEWDVAELESWGVEVPDEKSDIDAEKSLEINREMNYVVLIAENDMDYLQMQTMFDLKQVQVTKGAKGIGRILKFSNVVKKLQGDGF